MTSGRRGGRRGRFFSAPRPPSALSRTERRELAARKALEQLVDVDQADTGDCAGPGPGQAAGDRGRRRLPCPSARSSPGRLNSRLSSPPLRRDE